MCRTYMYMYMYVCIHIDVHVYSVNCWSLEWYTWLQVHSVELHKSGHPEIGTPCISHPLSQTPHLAYFTFPNTQS